MKRILFILALLLIWLFMFVAMHLVTFDLFGDNLWFHYVIGCVLLVAQLVVVRIIRKTQKKEWGYAAFSFVYLILCITVTCFYTSGIAMHDSSPQGLTIWCIILDLTGACYCILKWGADRKKTRT